LGSRLLRKGRPSGRPFCWMGFETRAWTHNLAAMLFATFATISTQSGHEDCPFQPEFGFQGTLAVPVLGYGGRPACAHLHQGAAPGGRSDLQLGRFLHWSQRRWRLVPQVLEYRAERP